MPVVGGLGNARAKRARFLNKYINIHKTTNASELLGPRPIRGKRKNYAPRNLALYGIHSHLIIVNPNGGIV